MTATIHKIVLLVLLMCAAVQSEPSQQGRSGRGHGGRHGGGSGAERTGQVLSQCRGQGWSEADAERVMAPVYTAQDESLPPENILVKIEEGVAKKVAPPLIARAADVRLNYLRRADQLVGSVDHIRGGWVGRMTSSVALVLESGLPENVVREVLVRVEDGRPGRIVPVIDAGMALYLAGYSAEQTKTIMLDCIGRGLTPLEVERALEFLLSEQEKGRDFQSVYRELWVQPE